MIKPTVKRVPVPTERRDEYTNDNASIGIVNIVNREETLDHNSTSYLFEERSFLFLSLIHI